MVGHLADYCDWSGGGLKTGKGEKWRAEALTPNHHDEGVEVLRRAALAEGWGFSIGLGGMFCEALFEYALVDAGWVGEVLALTDGGGDSLGVVQEAGSAGCPHSRG